MGYTEFTQLEYCADAIHSAIPGGLTVADPPS